MYENHLMPFLWIRSEDEKVYRRLIRAIDEANMKAFCVEARPHEGFCGETWWRDMDVILDEAEKRGMKVWILDDKHFPTGFAAGGALKAPLRLRRQSIFHKSVAVQPNKRVKISIKKYSKVICKPDLFGFAMDKINGNGKIVFDDDRLFSCTGYGNGKQINLSGFIRDGVLSCTVPEGVTSIELCYLTRNVGIHRSYINMLEPESCKILLDEVYEKHYAHYKDKFGTVIAGFFSDEPELGNSYYCNRKNRLGEDPNLDLCWSDSLERELERALGQEYKNYLPLLWKNDGDADQTARVRYAYMDCVTRLVENIFSKQIGEWCRARGVEYIGHLIEDSDLHCRTGSSLGHYFRGIQYQSMGGVDCIGGQVMPQGEDNNKKSILFGPRDGEFNHYALAKMASSIAQVNPIMHGRSMCEIFGNYGWAEGVRLEKYLIDHFAVRGVNYFVPHAFNCKAYPDKDCPPHFFAHGNNPQYRHFGALMAYTNRVCNLISGGRADTRVAVLYHGEAEWTGKYMLMQKPARELYDANVDFSFVPSDIFAERDFYGTKISEKLRAGQGEFSLLVVPYAERITKETAEGICELLQRGGNIVFIDDYPKGLCTGEPLPEGVKNADCVKLGELAGYAIKQGLAQVSLSPQTKRLRCLHYFGQREFWFIVNEDAQAFTGEIEIPTAQNIFAYDAWENSIAKVQYVRSGDKLKVKLSLDPSKSLFLMAGDSAEKEPFRYPKAKKTLTTFRQSVCRSIDYPKFGKEKIITELQGYEKTDKKFSGFIRYETEVDLGNVSRAVLEITDAYEGVELFVNGKSCGIQVVPKFIYDITDKLVQGKNALRIEVATTLERERKGKSKFPTGITGKVNLYTE